MAKEKRVSARMPYAVAKDWIFHARLAPLFASLRCSSFYFSPSLALFFIFLIYAIGSVAMAWLMARLSSLCAEFVPRQPCRSAKTLGCTSLRHPRSTIFSTILIPGLWTFSTRSQWVECETDLLLALWCACRICTKNDWDTSPQPDHNDNLAQRNSLFFKIRQTKKCVFNPRFKIGSVGLRVPMDTLQRKIN